MAISVFVNLQGNFKNSHGKHWGPFVVIQAERMCNMKIIHEKWEKPGHATTTDLNMHQYLFSGIYTFCKKYAVKKVSKIIFTHFPQVSRSERNKTKLPSTVSS